MNIVIIGANRGIGLELVKHYLKDGHTVTATCRQPTLELEQLNCTVLQHIDVTDDASMARLKEQVRQPHIDILIHNSGVLQPDRFPNATIESLQRHFNINTLGPYRTVTALLDKLVSGSKVGIVSSRVGSIADNTSSNNYAYRVSKTAVNMLGKCLSIDLAEQGIAVALLHPGYVKTDMTQGRGFVEAKEAAQGLIDTMTQVSLENTGSFFHANGEILPW